MAIRLSTLCVWAIFPIVGIAFGSDGLMKADKSHLSVVCVLTPPFLMKKDDGTYEGFSVDLADRLAQIIGIDNVTFHEPKDGKFGSKLQDNSWNGMIGDLVRNEADAAIGPLTITSQRERVVDFTKPFMSTGITMVTKRRTRTSFDSLVGNSTFLFLKPLHVGVWVIIIVGYLTTSVLVGIIERLAAKPDESAKSSIGKGFWWTIQAFTLQGFFKGPSAVGARTLLVFWFGFSVITISMYIASMVNFLGVEADLLENLTEGVRPQFVTRKHPIHSVEQLARQTSIKYGAITDSSTYGFFKLSSVSVYQEIFSRIISEEKSLASSVADGLDRVLQGNGKFILFTDSALADYYVRQKPCSLETIGGLLNSNGYGVATPIGSTYRDVISLAILSLHETGTLAQMQRKWFKDECVDEGYTLEVENDKGVILGRVVGPRQFTGVAVLLLLGMIISSVVAAAEFTRSNTRRKEPEETQLASAANCTDEKA